LKALLLAAVDGIDQIADVAAVVIGVSQLLQDVKAGAGPVGPVIDGTLE